MLFSHSIQVDPAAGAAAREARSAARGAQNEVEQVRFEVERLLMITEALWTILKEQHGYEDEELVKRIVAIDMRDGKLDGKLPASPPQKCPKCDRTLVKNRPRCLYCGEPIAPDPFAR